MILDRSPYRMPTATDLMFEAMRSDYLRIWTAVLTGPKTRTRARPESLLRCLLAVWEPGDSALRRSE